MPFRPSSDEEAKRLNELEAETIRHIQSHNSTISYIEELRRDGAWIGEDTYEWKPDRNLPIRLDCKYCNPDIPYCMLNCTHLDGKREMTSCVSMQGGECKSYKA